MTWTCLSHEVYNGFLFLYDKEVHRGSERNKSLFKRDFIQSLVFHSNFENVELVEAEMKWKKSYKWWNHRLSCGQWETKTFRRQTLPRIMRIQILIERCESHYYLNGSNKRFYRSLAHLVEPWSESMAINIGVSHWSSLGLALSLNNRSYIRKGLEWNLVNVFLYKRHWERMQARQKGRKSTREREV